MAHERLRSGLAAEARFAAYLTASGWHVAPFGQASMGDPVVRILRALLRPVGWRWLPDLLVQRAHDVFLVDVKSAPDARRNVAIELAAWEAHATMQQLGIAILYAVQHEATWLCCLHDELRALAPAPRDDHDGSGSGTPYRLYKKRDWHVFEHWSQTRLAPQGPQTQARTARLDSANEPVWACEQCRQRTPIATMEQGRCPACQPQAS